MWIFSLYFNVLYISLMVFLCALCIFNSGDGLMIADGGMQSSYFYLFFLSEQHLFDFALAEL